MGYISPSWETGAVNVIAWVCAAALTVQAQSALSADEPRVAVSFCQLVFETSDLYRSITDDPKMLTPEVNCDFENLGDLPARMVVVEVDVREPGRKVAWLSGNLFVRFCDGPLLPGEAGDESTRVPRNHNPDAA